MPRLRPLVAYGMPLTATSRNCLLPACRRALAVARVGALESRAPLRGGYPCVALDGTVTNTPMVIEQPQ